MDTVVSKELMEEKYQILMDFMPGGVVIYRGVDGEILEYSKGVHEVLGLDDETAPSFSNFYQMVHPSDVERVKEMIETQLEFLHSVFLNVRLVGTDDEVRMCEYRGRVLSEENGERIYMALLKDLSEENMLRRSLKQKEEKIQQQEYLIELLQEWAGDAAFTYDRLEDELTVCFRERDAYDGMNRTLPGRYTAFWQEQRLKNWFEPESVEKLVSAYHGLGGKEDSGSVDVVMNAQASWMPGKKMRMDYRAVLSERGSVLHITGRLISINE